MRMRRTRSRGWRRFAVALLLAIAAAGVSAAPGHGSDGSWERTWGKDVINGVPQGFEICTSALTCKAGGAGASLGGELDGPEFPAADAAGNVYVADSINSRMQMFDSQGNFLRAWGRNVVQNGGVGDVCSDTDAGQINPTLLCAEVCTVQASCADGYPFSSYGGEFAVPNAVAVDGAGNVYVTDANRIQKFNSNGGFMRAWGRDVVLEDRPGDVDPDGFEICTAMADCKLGVAGGLGGEVNNPEAIAADAAGNVYVADRGNARIQKFDSQGNLLLAWGVVGTQGGQFGSVRGVAADDAGNVYVADAANNRIQRFDSLGGFQLAWGRNVVQDAGVGQVCTDAQAAVLTTPCFEVCSVSPSCKSGGETGLGGELDSPEGIAARAGSVYVTDRDNERVQKFTAAGAFLSAWGKDVVAGGTTVFEVCTIAANCQADNIGTTGGELDEPEGVAVDPAGNVYVADKGNDRIQKFSGIPSTVTPPPPPPPTPPISAAPARTGERAAALKKCKKKKGKARKKCRKRAGKLPV
jgi:sugar lactone lactonase YvrE